MKIYFIPKVWLSVFTYFAITEIIIIIFEPNLLLDWNLIFVRLLFLVLFLAIYFFKNQFSDKNFQIINAVLVYALMGFLYKETATFNSLILPKIDIYLSNLDQKLFGYQPSLLFSEKLNTHFWNEIFYFGYFCYYLFPLIIFGVLYKNIPNKIEEFGFILISSFLVYYLIFICIPAVGPQFYFPFPENHIESKGIFGNAIKYIQKNGEAPTAAFPSSHVGISWIMVFWLFKNYRNLVKFFLPFVILLMFSTVYIKAHYFVDAIAGLITAPIIFFLTFNVYKFLNQKIDVHFD